MPCWWGSESKRFGMRGLVWVILPTLGDFEAHVLSTSPSSEVCNLVVVI